MINLYRAIASAFDPANFLLRVASAQFCFAKPEKFAARSKTLQIPEPKPFRASPKDPFRGRPPKNPNASQSLAEIDP